MTNPKEIIQRINKTMDGSDFSEELIKQILQEIIDIDESKKESIVGILKTWDEEIPVIRTDKILGIFNDFRKKFEKN